MSNEAVLVIAGVMPLRLMAKQLKLVYDNKGRMGKVNAAKEARDIVLDAWWHDWDCTEKGGWTHRLIGQIRPWTERKHGEVNYYITQFLTGHGFFLAYLYKIGKVSSIACVYCRTALDNAEHTFFACSRWTDKRTELECMTGCLTPDTIVSMMIRKRENWNACANFVEKVLRETKADEHLVDYSRRRGTR